MRIFIAITPPQEIRSEVENLIAGIKKNLSPSIQWENIEKIHLTIAFLGQISDESAHIIRGLLQAVAQRHAPFELRISNISYFYKRHGDSIIYIDVEDPQKLLKNLYSDLQQTFFQQQYSLPERLDPHVTIGRLKGTRFPHEKKQILAQINKLDINFSQNLFVQSIEIYESFYSKSADTSNFKIINSFPLGQKKTQ